MAHLISHLITEVHAKADCHHSTVAGASEPGACASLRDNTLLLHHCCVLRHLLQSLADDPGPLPYG